MEYMRHKNRYQTFFDILVGLWINSKPNVDERRINEIKNEKEKFLLHLLWLSIG